MVFLLVVVFLGGGGCLEVGGVGVGGCGKWSGGL